MITHCTCCAGNKLKQLAMLKRGQTPFGCADKRTAPVRGVVTSNNPPCKLADRQPAAARAEIPTVTAKAVPPPLEARRGFLAQCFSKNPAQELLSRGISSYNNCISIADKHPLGARTIRP